ncbi:MAG: hypothetical protein HC902_08285 [Calothrix sp. SM1_5_4]|nr:hypothetical protein [Calothrix sp. SM1_5_4]
MRWPGVLLAHATLAVWLRLLKPYLDEQQRLYWLLLALLSPLVGGSALMVTPDLPLMFFYGLSFWLFFLWRENPIWWRSLALGLCLGLGFTSKYMMVLLVLSLLPPVLFDRKSRSVLLRGLPWILAGGIVGTTPVWLWNVLNDFVSFKFQTAHGLGRKVWKPSWTIEYVGLQLLLIFPPVLYWAIRAWRRLPRVLRLWRGLRCSSFS